MFMCSFCVFLCTVFVTYFSPFLSETCFFLVQVDCLGQTPGYIKEKENLLTGRAKMSNWPQFYVTCLIGFRRMLHLRCLTEFRIHLCYTLLLHTSVTHFCYTSEYTSEYTSVIVRTNLKIYQYQPNTSFNWHMEFESLENSFSMSAMGPQYSKIKYT